MHTVHYLGHSAWRVETSECYWLFDCQDENAKQVDLSLLQDKPVFMFFSHRHHDHYSPLLHRQAVDLPGVTTVLGGFVTKDRQNTITVQPYEVVDLDYLVLYTAASTDEGVCMLVRSEDLCVFFAGDHADWGDDDSKLYYREIDYLADLGFKIDIAFIPVCTYSGARPKVMTEGAIYAIEKLRPGVTYPMHANGREHLYKEFEQDLCKTGRDVHSDIICVNQSGG